jgi:hypothetical protein
MINFKIYNYHIKWIFYINNFVSNFNNNMKYIYTKIHKSFFYSYINLHKPKANIININIIIIYYIAFISYKFPLLFNNNNKYFF